MKKLSLDEKKEILRKHLARYTEKNVHSIAKMRRVGDVDVFRYRIGKDGILYLGNFAFGVRDNGEVTHVPPVS